VEVGRGSWYFDFREHWGTREKPIERKKKKSKEKNGMGQ
jgi:hypothetical protein